MKETPTPIRMVRSRKHKQTSPNGLEIKYAGRPTKWGNPFKVIWEINGWVVKDKEGNYYGVVYDDQRKAIDKAIECHRGWADGQIAIGNLNIDELRNKNISCWCALGKPCHVDYLLKIANDPNYIP